MNGKVTVTEANGALGQTAPSADGISLLVCSAVALSGQITLGTVLGPFSSPADANAVGINAAYDLANSVMLSQHINDFFENATVGTLLYVLPVAQTVTLTQMPALAQPILAANGGDIKLVGLARIPNSGYTATIVDEFDGDVFTAVTAAQVVVTSEFTNYRPVSFIIEGRDFQGTTASTKNLRDPAGLNCNRVGVMIGNDNTVAQSQTYRNNYAAVGYALGRLAGIPVQRNMGRVKDGALSITNAGLSNGVSCNALNDSDVDNLGDNGYIFMLQYAGTAGYYFNDDPTAAPVTDDYSQLRLGRVMDKVARIARAVYIQEIHDEVEIDPTSGQIAVASCKAYQGEAQSQLDLQMLANNNYVSATPYVNAAQNVLSTGKVAITITVVPLGDSGEIDITLTYDNPALTA